MTELPEQLDPSEMTDADRAGLDLLAAVDAVVRVAVGGERVLAEYVQEAQDRLSRINQSRRVD